MRAARSTNETPRIGIRDTSSTDTVIAAPRSRKQWWLLGSLIVLIVAAVVVYPALSRWSEAAVSVSAERLRLGTVTRGDFVRDIGARGTVVAAVRPTLFAPAEGIVSLHIKAGDRVTTDDIVATIDSPNLDNELLQEEATLQSLVTELERQRIVLRRQALLNQQTIDLAQVAINAADRELRRAEIARESNVISKQDYEKAIDDLDTSRLRFEHAKQNAALEKDELTFELKTDQLALDRQALLVANLQRRVDALSISAPANGIVGDLLVEQKSAVAANQPLLTVIDLTAFEIEMTVSEAYANDLSPGIQAEISYGGQSHPGIVTAVSPEVQNNQVTSRVRFANETPAGLRQNQRVSVRVVLERSDDVLMVERGPFFDTGAGRVAYVLEDGVARRRAIQVGTSSVESLQVLDGLKEGETIILSGISEFDGAETVYVSN